MKPLTYLAVLVGGALFGYGLSWSTMIQPEVVLSFLRWQDFGLLLVLGAAVVVTGLVYFLAPKLMTKSLSGASFGRHMSVMNRDTLLGAALFGIGWGVSGVCPGPAIAGLGAGNYPLLWSLAGLFAGAWVQGWWASHTES